MGWTVIAEKPSNKKTFLDREMGIGIVASRMVGSVYYAAWKNQGLVSAVVVLTQTGRDGSFSYKDMGEESLPYLYDCPASLLDLLDPPQNEDAKTWRERCWKRLQEKKLKLEEGQEVEFAKAIQFSDGIEERHFVAKYRIIKGRKRLLFARRQDSVLCQLKNWKTFQRA